MTRRHLNEPHEGRQHFESAALGVFVMSFEDAKARVESQAVDPKSLLVIDVRTADWLHALVTPQRKVLSSR